MNSRAFSGADRSGSPGRWLRADGPMGRWADGPMGQGGRSAAALQPPKPAPRVLGAEFWGSCFGGCIVKRCEVGVTGPQRVGGSPDIEIPKRLRIIQSLRGSCNPSSTGFGDPFRDRPVLDFCVPARSTRHYNCECCSQRIK